MQKLLLLSIATLDKLPEWRENNSDLNNFINDESKATKRGNNDNNDNYIDIANNKLNWSKNAKSKSMIIIIQNKIDLGQIKTKLKDEKIEIYDVVYNENIDSVLSELCSKICKSRNNHFSFLSSHKHLISEFQKLKKQKLRNIAVIPEESDIFKWHINIKPFKGSFAQQVIHLIFRVSVQCNWFICFELFCI